MVIETDAVIADAEAELGGLDTFEALYVAFAGVQITGQRAEDTQGSRRIDGAELRLGLIVPDKALAHA